MKLYLIASTKLREGYEEFLANRNLRWRESKNTTEGQRLIEFSGRVCYLSFGANQSPKSNSEYISHLLSQGHESVFEHATYTILADYISRALSHQLVRHRIGFSYSQLSQQYHDESHADSIVPTDLEKYPKIRKQWRDAIFASMEAYKTIQDMLLASNYSQHRNRKERMRAIRSVARSVLPNATSTSLVMTGNARAWRHLFSVRGSIAGDAEMRMFCVEVFRLLEREAPDVFRDFEIRGAGTDSCLIRR